MKKSVILLAVLLGLILLPACSQTPVSEETSASDTTQTTEAPSLSGETAPESSASEEISSTPDETTTSLEDIFTMPPETITIQMEIIDPSTTTPQETTSAPATNARPYVTTHPDHRETLVSTPATGAPEGYGTTAPAETTSAPAATTAPQHVHTFDVKTADAKHFAADADADHGTLFYLSCACGEMSKDTFEQGRKATEFAPVGSKKDLLDGKKILFVGCSYTYYGNTVIKKTNDVRSQEKRSDDQGYFYQLCKANGAEVSVTNWTYGDHALSDILSGKCATGRSCDGTDHLRDLTDRSFDYVVLQDLNQPQGRTVEQYVETIKGYAKLFTDVNPNVKILYAIHTGVYYHTYKLQLPYYSYYRQMPALKLLEEEGIISVVDWGLPIADIIGGTASVPGSKQTYNGNSFVVANTEKDGYHPNMLTGYLISLSVYCTITGETAVGQPYAFCTDTTLDAAFSATKYRAAYYKYDKKTNFVDVLNSPEEMEALQKIFNRYQDMKVYLTY